MSIATLALCAAASYSVESLEAGDEFKDMATYKLDRLAAVQAAPSEETSINWGAFEGTKLVKTGKSVPVAKTTFLEGSYLEQARQLMTALPVSESVISEKQRSFVPTDEVKYF